MFVVHGIYMFVIFVWKYRRGFYCCCCCKLQKKMNIGKKKYVTKSLKGILQNIILLSPLSQHYKLIFNSQTETTLFGKMKTVIATWIKKSSITHGKKYEKTEILCFTIYPMRFTP